jgi:hypothetical protein
VHTDSYTFNVDDFPGLTAGAEVEVEFSYRPGSSDFFAGGCWNPGDSPELKVGAAYPTEGETSVVDGISYYGQFSPIGPFLEYVERFLYENPPEPYYDSFYPED